METERLERQTAPTTIGASPPTRDVWALHYAECSRQAREAQDASEAYEDVVSEAESELEEKASAAQAQTGFRSGFVTTSRELILHIQLVIKIP